MQEKRNKSFWAVIEVVSEPRFFNPDTMSYNQFSEPPKCFQTGFKGNKTLMFSSAVDFQSKVVLTFKSLL